MEGHGASRLTSVKSEIVQLNRCSVSFVCCCFVVGFPFTLQFVGRNPLKKITKLKISSKIEFRSSFYYKAVHGKVLSSDGASPWGLPMLSNMMNPARPGGSWHNTVGEMTRPISLNKHLPDTEVNY